MNIAEYTKIPEIQMPEIPSFSEALFRTIIKKVRALEAGLKPEQKLLAYCETPSGERIQALQLQFTGGPLILVYGVDREENVSCLMLHASAFQMVCKIVKAKPEDKKRTPIGFVTPESEPKKS